jgi:hypothetical protein
MNDDEAAAEIKKECMTGDNECDHSAADDILCSLLLQLGYTKTVEAWQAVHKWYA